MLTKAVHATQKVASFSFALLIPLGVVICIYTPNYFLFKWGVSYATQIMIGYFVLGLVFFLLKKERLMFTSFICCAILCLYLKESFNPILKNPEKTDEPIIKVAHFNLGNGDENPDTTIAAMLRTNADLLSIQEVTPDWWFSWDAQFQEKYPYSIVLPRLDLYGIAIYSKQPISNMDTLMYGDVPNVVGSIPVENKGDVFFISSHIAPSLSLTFFEKMQEQLEIIHNKCLQINAPILTFGDYNAVPWSDEIRNFKENTKLHDSRRGVMPTFPHGNINFLEVPLDHIFYSGHFSCIDFETISSNTSKHLGIQGMYQFVSPPES